MRISDWSSDVCSSDLGAFVASADGKAFENRRPHDGSLIGHVAEGGRAEVDAAVSAARAALDGPWAALSVDERSDLIRGVADGITKRFDDFLAAKMADTGQPRSMMAHAFIPRGPANFMAFAHVLNNVEPGRPAS